MNSNTATPTLMGRPAALPFHSYQQMSNSPPPATSGTAALAQPQQTMPVVSPGVSPVPNRQPIAIPQYATNPLPQYLPAMAHPTQLPAVTWQQQQQQQQFQKQQLVGPDENDHQQYHRIASPLNDDDVSSVPYGSIRPDPRYNPANDPFNPSNMDKPFVPPQEIIITIVRARRRSNMEHYSTSKVEEDPSQSTHTEWLKPSNTPPSPNSPMVVGLSTSADNSDSYLVLNSSFDTDVATYTVNSEEEYQDLRNTLLALQKLTTPDEVPAVSAAASMEVTEPQRRGMVRRELKRRVLRFKKKKAETLPEEMAIVDAVQTITIGDHTMDIHAPIVPKEPAPIKPAKKKGMGYYSPFGTHYNKSKMMTMVVDQENGC